jgi:hypothetical protein
MRNLSAIYPRRADFWPTMQQRYARTVLNVPHTINGKIKVIVTAGGAGAAVVGGYVVTPEHLHRLVNESQRGL